MAGTLVIDNLTDGSGNTTSATNAIRGSARAWVVTEGGSATVYGSYNVSSVTYNSNNLRTVNFTNAFADANYAPVIGTCATSDIYARPYQITTPSTINCTFSGNGGVYSGRLAFAFFR
jgi:hypothetical protein